MSIYEQPRQRFSFDVPENKANILVGTIHVRGFISDGVPVIQSLHYTNEQQKLGHEMSNNVYRPADVTYLIMLKAPDYWDHLLEAAHNHINNLQLN